MDDERQRKRKLYEDGAKRPEDGVPRFSMATQKKTKFDKEREEQERKKRIADQEAAQVYESFVASFEHEPRQAFVQAGALSAPAYTPQRYQTPPPLRRPTPGPARSSSATSSSSSSAKVKAFAFAMDEEDEPPVVDVPRKKIREMDLFLQEIKEHKFEPAPAMDVYPHRDIGGSHDDGVGDTTNLYVGNLPPTITEDALRTIFEEYGAIYSVKIMWPRNDEERLRGRLTGFVCFRRRDDADDARQHLNERIVDGQEIMVGWGKAVRMDAPKPPSMFAPPLAFPRPLLTPPPTTFARPPPPPSMGFPPRPPFPGPPPRPTMMMGTPPSGPPRGLPFARPPIIVELPDKDTVRYVNRFAECVAEGGPQMEDAMRLRPDDRFLFLNDPNSSLFHYYKWKVLSLRRGENDYRWGRDPIPGENGLVYLPPPPRDNASSSLVRDGAPRSRSSSPARSPRPARRTHHRFTREASSPRTNSATKDKGNVMTGAQLAAARDKEEGRRRNLLDADDYDDFCELLEDVTLERDAICDVMAFALDHSECAADIVSILAKAFRVEYTENTENDDDHDEKTQLVLPPMTYVARLYVISDILHNSTAPKKNASLYRTQFEECLPEIMQVLNHVHQTIVGRMSFNSMRDKVLSVLNAWETWSLFPPSYLLGLNATFLAKKDPSDVDPRSVLGPEILNLSEDRLKRKCKQAGLVSSGSMLDMYACLAMLQRFTSVSKAPPTSANNPDDLDGAPMDEVPDAPMGGDDDDDIDGVPLDGNHEDEDDLDGEPIDEDVDGEPLDDDVDGEPLDDNDAA
ncbi:hypothetical protein SPRG_03167 [Saprolegnia parasitica CBS 223.65]|uniref:RRM domain-containing protein n=1 Tax=Saprolegnia parasitica (strain CBS 223.65) TaxID=695850 RepID=A0A067CYR7_SAPPC|nr:hypothetical protein SPRG_03167 [Saprolegnia parasitica CBS 223.65]KDO31952.1 hypothetical protein SPRG_03167 [Saprolegnia parasitica CBS 223.65]|eukprot:XP_012197149.1 hypothetical protein SPRG_03167 [Saprolegnia parasitica CBS 223.65]